MCSRSSASLIAFGAVVIAISGCRGRELEPPPRAEVPVLSCDARLLDTLRNTDVPMTVEGPLRTNHSGALELCQGLLIVGVIDRSALHGAVIRALVEELGQPAYGLKVAAVFDARARVTIDSATDPEDDVLELRRSLSSGGVDPFATHVGDALLYLPPYGARPTRWFLLSSLREVGWDEAAIPDGFQARGPLWVDLAP